MAGIDFTDKLKDMEEMWAERTAKAGDFENLPPGIYNMRLISAELRENKDGTPQIMQKYLVYGGESDGKFGFNFQQLVGEWGPTFFAQWVEALGYAVPTSPTDIPALLAEMNVDAPACKVNVRESKGFTNLRVTRRLDDDDLPMPDRTIEPGTPESEVNPPPEENLPVESTSTTGKRRKKKKGPVEVPPPEESGPSDLLDDLQAFILSQGLDKELDTPLAEMSEEELVAEICEYGWDAKDSESSLTEGELDLLEGIGAEITNREPKTQAKKKKKKKAAPTPADEPPEKDKAEEMAETRRGAQIKKLVSFADGYDIELDESTTDTKKTLVSHKKELSDYTWSRKDIGTGVANILEEIGVEVGA